MPIECLRGTGELMIAARIAQALVDKGFDVVVASGNPRRFFENLKPVIKLPAISYDEQAGKYKTEDGRNLDDALDWKNDRTKRLIELYDKEKPDAVLLSYWPFGNGQDVLDDEMHGLINHIEASGKHTPIFGSIREVLHVDSKPRGDDKKATADFINAHFDRLFVHGDKAHIRLKDEGDHYTTINDNKLHYTGYVCESYSGTSAGDKNAIIITAGGGDYRSSSAVVLKKAIAALEKMNPSILEGKTVHVLVGKCFQEPEHAAEFKEIKESVAAAKTNLANKKASIILQEPMSPDKYKELLLNCALFIGQAGIGTVMDVMSYRYPAVLIPVVEENKAQGYHFKEQKVRADIFAGKQLFKVMEQGEIEKGDGSALARYAEAAIAQRSDAKKLIIKCDGAKNTAEAIAAALDRKVFALQHARSNSPTIQR